MANLKSQNSHAKNFSLGLRLDFQAIEKFFGTEAVAEGGDLIRQYNHGTLDNGSRFSKIN